MHVIARHGIARFRGFTPVVASSPRPSTCIPVRLTTASRQHWRNFGEITDISCYWSVRPTGSWTASDCTSAELEWDDHVRWSEGRWWQQWRTQESLRAV